MTGPGDKLPAGDSASGEGREEGARDRTNEGRTGSLSASPNPSTRKEESGTRPEGAQPDSQAVNFRSGYVGIMGLPNAGKSTLFNAILGQKLSIITPKAQTTRHRIQGIYTDERMQIVFVDTPGILEPSYRLQEHMMDQVRRLKHDVDLLLHLVDPSRIPEPGDLVFRMLSALKLPAVLVLNKIDKAASEQVLAAEQACTRAFSYSRVLRVSALQALGIEELMSCVGGMLPEGPAFFPPDEASDRPLRFFVEELVREQLFMLYDKEVPYSCAVNVTRYEEGPVRDVIHADVVVSRDSQKGILIGKGGRSLKQLGMQSRVSIEAFLGKEVYLQLFVKVREKWRDKDHFLSEYGYR